MEIPPDSSFAQSTALCAGRSRQDVMNSILFQFPTSDSNTILLSSDAAVAASSTGDLTDFKYDNFREAYRMMNRPPKYPFQNIAQISNYKFDPYYFDGSENQANFNVNENLIGTPLGTSLLEDPRLSYVKNLLTLREYEGQSDQLNDSYIKELYMVNSEKGANYYQNMLENQKVALDNWSREGRKRKNIPIQGIAFTHNLPAGETARTRKKRIVEQTIYSETPSVQRNYRRDIFSILPQDITDTVSTRSVTSQNSLISLGGSNQITPSSNASFSASDSASIVSSSASVSSANSHKSSVKTPIRNSSSPTSSVGTPISSAKITLTLPSQTTKTLAPGDIFSPMASASTTRSMSPTNGPSSLPARTPPPDAKSSNNSPLIMVNALKKKFNNAQNSISALLASNTNSSANQMVGSTQPPKASSKQKASGIPTNRKNPKASGESDQKRSSARIQAQQDQQDQQAQQANFMKKSAKK